MIVSHFIRIISIIQIESASVRGKLMRFLHFILILSSLKAWSWFSFLLHTFFILVIFINSFYSFDPSINLFRVFCNMKIYIIVPFIRILQNNYVPVIFNHLIGQKATTGLVSVFLKFLKVFSTYPVKEPFNTFLFLLPFKNIKIAIITNLRNLWTGTFLPKFK